MRSTVTLLIGLIFILWGALSVQQTNVGKQYHFGVGIFSGPQSSVLTYAIITTSGDQVIGTQIVNEQRFMYTIMGYWPHSANPQRINLLEANGVDSCFLYKNQFDKIIGFYAKPFNDLWKIRYKEHPYKYDTNGWGQNLYSPSPAQSRFLYQEYGVKHIQTEYFFGDTLYKLLKDVETESWVSKYKAYNDSIP